MSGEFINQPDNLAKFCGNVGITYSNQLQSTPYIQFCLSQV